ncbi:metal ABC transporter solute-binding protein, Zn/Mn family [Bifidobacterium cuniculi]|uniref:Metal ion ABC transporter substrate-binding protein n=1 Tax=Bifidobacterium cuniculi TaxID=1688 RepID=A0A087AY91_9BIFI|nr:zinc ABC transporter substrate-binding protein [Bifidobacterium cuniculi]KFI63741.1 metal ion ABC transporter substrate-binding protein [Bifidobacterium cuniculi]
MKKLLTTLATALTAVGLLAAVSACGSGTASSDASTGSSSDKVITVIASSNQWGSLAKQLGGEYVDVTSILNNTSTEAHDYEPTSNDISKIQHAEVAIVNGAGYDEWASKAAEQSKAIVIDAASEGGKQDGDNPHVWFSAEVRTKTADAITAAYEKLQPGHKAEFEKLNEQWNAEEKALDEELSEIAKADGGDKAKYAATESVAEYLAEDMDFEDVTPTGYKQAAANESEPTASDIKQFTDLLKKGDLQMLIVNTQEPSSMTDQLIAAADSGNVPVVDVTEQMPEQYKSLHEWLKAIADQVKATE